MSIHCLIHVNGFPLLLQYKPKTFHKKYNFLCSLAPAYSLQHYLIPFPSTCLLLLENSKLFIFKAFIYIVSYPWVLFTSSFASVSCSSSFKCY